MTSPLIPGAEPMSRRGGPTGVLVLHGFTGNPQSMRPMAELLADCGFTVEMPLLPGHGTVVEDMIPTRFADWSTAADAAFERIAEQCDEVAVFALSMGGTLALWLAERHPEIRALVLVNPMAEVPANSFLDVMRGVFESGIEVAPGVGSDIAKEGSVELAYPGSPVAAALSLFEGVADVAARLDRISCPVLLFSSRQDHVVPSSSGDYLEAHLRAPLERIWLERSYHVATLDYDAPEIEQRTLSFLSGILGSPDAAPRAAGDDVTRSASTAATHAASQGS